MNTESNRLYHYLFKYVFLIAGQLITFFQVSSFIFPDSVEIKVETGSIYSFTTITIGLILVLVFFLIKDKFAIVDLSNQTITIKQNGEERTLNWLDVVLVSWIQFLQPTLFKPKRKDREETIWFNTCHFHIKTRISPPHWILHPLLLIGWPTQPRVLGRKIIIEKNKPSLYFSSNGRRLRHYKSQGKGKI